MRNFEYFQMRVHFFLEKTQDPVPFKLKELEGVWHCSAKNVKRKLKQYAMEGKCVYQPGMGRGVPSRIAFHQPLKEEIEQEVSHLAKRNKLEDIMQLLQLPIPKAWITNISKDIRNLFGLHTSEESKDVLRTVVSRTITTLDPALASINFECFLLQQLGDPLVAFDPDSGSISPHLAHHWEANDTSTVWTFYLRKGVKFHNQSLLTSEDVKYTFSRFQTLASSHAWLVEDIEQIYCPSPHIVQFILHKPNPFFARYASSHHLSILPRNESFNDYAWIGTGPFQIKKRTESLLILQAFDDYFWTRPILDEVEIYSISFETTTLITYDVDRQKTEEDLVNKNILEIGFRFLAFNFKKESVIRHPAFRKALFHLYDVKRMGQDLKRDNFLEASSYFHWKSKAQTKNRKWVKPFIEESNYQGQPLVLYAPSYPSHRAEAEWFVNEAKHAGIRIELKTFILDNLYDLELDDADLILLGETASADYYLSFMGAFLNKSLIFNRFFSQDQLKHMRELFDHIKAESAPDQQERLMESVESYIREQNLFLYLYHPVKRRAFHPMLNDVEFDSFGFVDFKRLWVKSAIV